MKTKIIEKLKDRLEEIKTAKKWYVDHLYKTHNIKENYVTKQFDKDKQKFENFLKKQLT
jgi:hypothetical protein